MSSGVAPAWCTDRPLAERPLLDETQGDALAALFKVLANSSRLRLLHALLRADELRVTDLAEQADMTPQAVSNQLRRLADNGVLSSRRAGNEIRYRVVDPCVPGLIDLAMCLLAQRDT